MDAVVSQRAGVFGLAKEAHVSAETWETSALRISVPEDESSASQVNFPLI
jgi:hypothetical protein